MFLFGYFIVGPVVGWILYKIFAGAFNSAGSIGKDPMSLPYHEQPAGRIHLFESNRYFYSTCPDNPYDHPELDWMSGRIGAGLATDMVEYPEYQFSVIGSMEVLKPENEKGLMVVLMDNDKLRAVGLEPFGLMYGAQKLVERAISEQTVQTIRAKNGYGA